MPDYESVEEVVHLYGEATTFARLAWNPQYDVALERRLRRVDCPALVVRAEHDRVVPDAVAERYAELLGARIERVDGTGHAIAVEQPDERRRADRRRTSPRAAASVEQARLLPPPPDAVPGHPRGRRDRVGAG